MEAQNFIFSSWTSKVDIFFSYFVFTFTFSPSPRKEEEKKQFKFLPFVV